MQPTSHLVLETFLSPEDHGIWDRLTSALPLKSADPFTVSAKVAVLLWNVQEEERRVTERRQPAFRLSFPKSVLRDCAGNTAKEERTEKYGTGKSWTKQEQEIQLHC